MAPTIKADEPLASHTVFKIGGPSRRFVEAQTSEDFVAALAAAAAAGEPWCILGAGSNVLVADHGFPGTVIHPVGGAVAISGDTVVADAAVPMARVVRESLAAGLRGFEWAIGVPGTIGGSVVGNAGCFGGEMQGVLRAVRMFDAARGATRVFSPPELGFGYRESVFKRHPEWVVLSATIRLSPGDRRQGQALVREHTRERLGRQDIGSQSAGCIFKNVAWDRLGSTRQRLLERFPGLPPSGTVPGIPAGFLVDQVGLKGYRIGSAKISERHGNFVVNMGGATAEEVVMLIALAKERVRSTFGVLLEEEIRYLGFA